MWYNRSSIAKKNYWMNRNFFCYSILHSNDFYWDCINAMSLGRLNIDFKICSMVIKNRDNERNFVTEPRFFIKNDRFHIMTDKKKLLNALQISARFILFFLHTKTAYIVLFLLLWSRLSENFENTFYWPTKKSSVFVQTLHF